MNPILLASVVITAVAFVPSATVRAVVATAASTLFEGAPFILAAAVVRAVVPRIAWLVPLLGCGCEGGPSARSLPAAIATGLAFGPWVAIARLAGAVVVGRLGDPRSCSHAPGVAGTLAQLVPYAFAAGICAHVMPMLVAPHGISPPACFAIGAIAAFVLAPCGLGVVGVAGALRALSPAATIGFLTVAGIVDLRAFVRPHVRHASRDGVAYALGAIACALVAIRHGDTLVHPRFTVPLAACAIGFAVAAWRFRTHHDIRVWTAPVLMCCALVINAPPPQYRATATTLSDAFPGEPLSFDGVVTRHGRTTSLVRYAITCCRADAAPIAVVLDRDVPVPNSTWAHVDGVFHDTRLGLRLLVHRFTRLTTPSDPFLYQ